MTGAQEIRAARRELGKQLAAYRAAVGLTQHQLAPLVFYGRSTVANAETGRQQTGRAFWERCDAVLGADGALLDAYEALQTLERQQRQETQHVADSARLVRYSQQDHAWFADEALGSVDEVKRRFALVLPALAFTAAMAAPVEPWARLAHALEHPRQLDAPTVEYLEWCTTEFFRREEHTPARQLLPELRSHIDRLEQLLMGGVPEGFRGRLLATTGEALALAGWLAWDSKEPTRAHGLYDQANEAARQAGDGPLYACVLAYRSYMAEAIGDLPGARRLLVDAQAYVRSERSVATRSWLAAREAEVSASLRDEATAVRALERALVVYDYAHPHRERAWTAFFTASRLGSMAVTTYARLDHPQLDATTDSVVASMPQTDAKIKAVILADVATAAIQRGRYDRGAELSYDALAQTLAQEVSISLQRLHGLHKMIQGKRHIPALAALDNHLTAHLA